jgi:hypothetical protein
MRLGSRSFARSAQTAVVLLSLGLATAGTACSSDPVAPGDVDAGGGGGGDDREGFDASFPTTKCPPYVAPAGKAKVTTPTGPLENVPEISCRTLRKRDGSVVGYAASFGRFEPISTTRKVRSQMERMDRLNIEAYGPYTGDGELVATRMNYTLRKADGSSSSGGGKLVLSDGGKKGVFTGGPGDADRIEFECDPRDDTAPTAGPALTDAPGRAIVERERGGDATVLEGISCKESAPSAISNFFLTHPFAFLSEPSDGPCVPNSTLLEAKVNGPGTYDLAPGSYVVTSLVEIGFVGTSVNGKTQVTLTAQNPAKGTFTGTTPSGAGGNNFNGSFTCPTR